MCHLDYFSCLLTVLSTVLVGRKLWLGLAVGALNSVLICVIGFKTSQFGFIPANVFCIAVYAVSIRSWRRETACELQSTSGEAGPALGGDSASDASKDIAQIVVEENPWQNPHPRLSRA